MPGDYIIDFGAMPTQMILLLISDIVIVYILYKLLYNPVLEFLAKRREKIEGQLNDAEQALNEANALKAQYDEKLKDIAKEKSEILDNARKVAKDREREIIEDAKNEADVIKNRALLDIKREEDRAKDDMKKQIIEISTIMASSYVATSLTDEDQNKLLNEAIESLEGTQWQI